MNRRLLTCCLLLVAARASAQPAPPLDLKVQEIKLPQHTVKLRGGETATRINAKMPVLYRIAFDPSGDHACLVFGKVQPAIFDRQQWRMTRLLPASRMVVFSPDGKHFATAEGTDGLRIWDAEDEQTPVEYLEAGPRSSVLCVDFSPDGTRLVSGHEDGRVQIWDVNGKQMISIHQKVDAMIWNLDSRIARIESNYFVADFSPTDPVAAIARDRIRFYRYESGSLKQPFATVDLTVDEKPFMASTLKFVPGEKQVAVGGTSGEILLVDVPDAE